MWPTPDVQNNVFTGFLDPENVGIGTKITFICLSFKVTSR